MRFSTLLRVPPIRLSRSPDSRHFPFDKTFAPNIVPKEGMKWVGEQPGIRLLTSAPEDTLIDKINEPIETGGMLAGLAIFPAEGQAPRELIHLRGSQLMKEKARPFGWTADSRRRRVAKARRNCPGLMRA